MRLIAITRKDIILTLVFTLFFFGTRIPKLGSDEINPDGVNWHYRSEQFVVGLKTGQLEKTYQHYHPGVTLMWSAGLPIELTKRVSDYKIYDKDSFILFNTVAKVAVVVVQYVLSIIGIYLFKFILKDRGEKYYLEFAFGTVLLLSLEPFFIGNSRLFHMDTMLALFLFDSLLLSYLYLKKRRGWLLLASTLFLSMSFLTKSIAILAILYVFAVGIGQFSITKDFKNLKKFLVVGLLSLVLFTFIQLPALIVSPSTVFLDIFNEAERVGIRKGHEQTVLGETTLDPGVLFYPLVILLKVSPFLLIGILFYGLLNYKKLVRLKIGLKPRELKTLFHSVSIYTYLAFFYLSYILVMIIPSKKLDRYMLPIYPFLAVFGTYGFIQLYSYTQNRMSVVQKKLVILATSVAFIIFVFCPVIKLHPYLFTYTSPLFGSAEAANKLIAQKPFGIGIPALKDYLFEKYGEYPPIGFIDTKPMRSIYISSRMHDIRESGASRYDIIVLGINEEFPEEITESTYKFVLDDTLIINGLDYWRIYVKQ